ncbi:hypothetical protein EON80_00400 [bacterium]|nr:MAG: hypothetical protein EON80_00400 [bacterium]
MPSRSQHGHVSQTRPPAGLRQRKSADFKFPQQCRAPLPRFCLRHAPPWDTAAPPYRTVIRQRFTKKYTLEQNKIHFALTKIASEVANGIVTSGTFLTQAVYHTWLDKILIYSIWFSNQRISAVFRTATALLIRPNLYNGLTLPMYLKTILCPFQKCGCED